MLVKSPLVFGRGIQKELRYDKTNPRPYAKSVARVARTPALQNDPVDPVSRAYRTNARRSFRQATVDTGCNLSKPSVPLHSGSHHGSAGHPLRAMVRPLNVPRTTAKLPVLRYAEAGAAVERTHPA